MIIILVIIVYLVSLAIIRQIRNLFMRLVGANFILVSPITTFVLAGFLTSLIFAIFGIEL